MKKLTHQDRIILGLVFLLILISSSLFLVIDELSIGTELPWHLGVTMFIGGGLLLVIHFPLASLVNLVSGHPPAPHGTYAAVLPFITALVYVSLLAIAMKKRLEKRK